MIDISELNNLSELLIIIITLNILNSLNNASVMYTYMDNTIVWTLFKYVCYILLILLIIFR